MTHSDDKAALLRRFDAGDSNIISSGDWFETDGPNNRAAAEQSVVQFMRLQNANFDPKRDQVFWEVRENRCGGDEIMWSLRPNWASEEARFLVGVAHVPAAA